MPLSKSQGLARRDVSADVSAGVIAAITPWGALRQGMPYILLSVYVLCEREMQDTIILVYPLIGSIGKGPC